MKHRARPLLVEELESRSMLSATHAALITSSSNWSGYAAETNLTNPAANAVSAVSGSWAVPTVTGSGTAYSSVWVGIDGYSSSSVEQIGISSDLVNGKASYSAWYEMYPALPVTISALTISPGDKISAEVSYASSQFTLGITDATTGKSYSTEQTLANAQRSSAEWIVEAPSSNFGVLPLANFGTVNFTQSRATIGGITGPIDDSAWQDAQINMQSGRTVEDETSSLTDAALTVGSSSITASSFSVTDTASTSTKHQPPPPPPPPMPHHHFFGPNTVDASNTLEVNPDVNPSNSATPAPSSVLFAVNVTAPAQAAPAIQPAQSQASPVTHGTLSALAATTETLNGMSADGTSGPDDGAARSAPGVVMPPAAPLVTDPDGISIEAGSPEIGAPTLLSATTVDGIFSTSTAFAAIPESFPFLENSSPSVVEILAAAGFFMGSIASWNQGSTEESENRASKKSGRSLPI